MDAAAFEVALKMRSLCKPFYVFAGNEDFLKERAFERLVTALIAPSDIAQNVSRLDFSSDQEAELFSSLGSFIFNDSPRVFLISNADSLSASNRAEFFERLCAFPIPENTYIIFMTSEAALVAEITRRLGSKCERVDFWAPFENQMVQWVQNEARNAGVTISIDAAEALLEKTGHDLRLIVQELDKLALQVGQGGKITSEIVSTAVGHLRQDAIYDLIDAIGMRDASRAMRITENLLQQGIPTLVIWAAIVNTLREFRLLHDLAADRPDLVNPVIENLRVVLQLHGRSDYRANQERKLLLDKIQQTLNSWPSILSEAILPNPRKARQLALALNYTRRELLDLWPRLIEIDAALKSTPVNELLFLQKCLLEIISPASLPQAHLDNIVQLNDRIF